jgi:phospholipid/cholesterol/gamma-HCH transport system ATP-binding protein
VILGGSGCGKSTLLRHIAGLSRPMAGKTLIGGQDLFALPPKEFRRLRRHMGMLFQDGALLGALTLAQNVALPLVEHTRLSPKVIDAAALRCLALVGLQDFGAYFPAQLSGGMRKRAGLARALVTEPRILLCDEPTSGLDPINAARMDQLLLDMKEHYPGMSLIVVSHDLASLARIADSVLVLREGGAVFQGGYADLCAVEDAYLQNFLQRQSPEDHRRTDGVDLPDPDVRAALRTWLDK